MIDASKSPMPLWKRLATVLLLAVLIVAAGYVLWTKELHHSAGESSSPTIPAAVAPAPARAASTTTTTVPGGIPVGHNSPFG